MHEKRIEELLPLVNDTTPTIIMSDIVEEYANVHFLIDKPAPAELTGIRLTAHIAREAMPGF